MIKINKLFVDFDGVIVNTIAAICDLYNEDFKYYNKYKYVFPEQVKTWNFDELNCASREYINTYFNQQRFFDKLKFMPQAYETLRKFALKGEVVIVSSGYSPNLRAKEEWCKEHLPFCQFIGVNLKEYKDKSHIDMNGGLFIDDSAHNLETSNAETKICFGEIYPWNIKWNGKHCWDWNIIYQIYKADLED